MSYDDVQLPRVNEGMYKIQIAQGVVLVKGKMDPLLYAIATTSDTPYYKMPKNCPTPNLQCRNRAICFQKRCDSGYDYSDVMNLYTPDDYGETGVPVLTSLYGQGEKNNKFDLYNTIKPFGIVYNGNEDNVTDKFNVQVGGTIEVSNNGPHRINVGDIVYADLPDVEPREFEKGRKELIFKVYRAEIHKSNNTGVRKCLDMIDDTNFKGYHYRFKELSEEYVELKLRLHFIHTQLYQHYQTYHFSSQERKELQAEEVKIMKDIESGIHPNFNNFKTSKLYESFKNFYFPRKDSNLKLATDLNKNYQLNLLLKETNERLDVIKAEFLHFQLDWILGRAVTSANPGEDFVIQLTNFSL